MRVEQRYRDVDRALKARSSGLSFEQLPLFLTPGSQCAAANAGLLVSFTSVSGVCAEVLRVEWCFDHAGIVDNVSTLLVTLCANHHRQLFACPGCGREGAKSVLSDRCLRCTSAAAWGTAGRGVAHG